LKVLACKKCNVKSIIQDSKFWSKVAYSKVQISMTKPPWPPQEHAYDVPWEWSPLILIQLTLLTLLQNLWMLNQLCYYHPFIEPNLLPMFLHFLVITTLMIDHDLFENSSNQNLNLTSNPFRFSSSPYQFT
jgi:hypothetical protein